MNARMSFKNETIEARLARKEKEKEERLAWKEFMKNNRTGFLKVGSGNVVHLASIPGDRTICGAEGTSSGQIRHGISSVAITNGPATCKRCLKMADNN